MRSYGREVRYARAAKQFSLAKLARAVSSFKGYISGIENGKVSAPSEKMTKKLCRVLGLDAARMLALAILEKRKSAPLHAIRQLCDEMIEDENARLARRAM